METGAMTGSDSTWNSPYATLRTNVAGSLHHAYRLMMEPLNDDCSFADYRITPAGVIIERALWILSAEDEC
jgi:hypothetical protein